MRNSSLVKRLSVDNTRDLNYLPKLWDQIYFWSVEEHSICTEGVSVRHAGADRKANVGISNDNEDEKSSRRKSKVSWAMLVISGLVGP